MNSLLNPKSIAVIGASRFKGKVGYAVYNNLLSSKLKVYPVNPNARSIMGNKVYSSVKEIKGNVDLAVICVPAKIVPQVISECAEKKINEAIIISAGFKEAGNKALEEEVLKIAKLGGVRLLGPNVLGVIKPGYFNASFFEGMPKKGGISFVSQSGALGVAVLDWAIKENIGLRYFISVGNMADLEFSELINELNNDPETKVIALYVESLVNGRAFMKSVKDSKKPVLVLKAGKSTEGQRAAASHTGALAGSDEVYEAAFKQCGARRVFSFNELIKSAQLIVDFGLISNKALIISNAGGPSILMTDACISNGLIIPKLPVKVKESLNKLLPAAWSHNNPIDVIGDAKADRYKKVLDSISKEDFYDIVIVMLTPQAMTEVKETAEEIITFQKKTKKAVIPCFLGGKSIDEGIKLFKEKGLFAFTEINEAADAIKNALKY